MRVGASVRKTFLVGVIGIALPAFAEAGEPDVVASKAVQGLGGDGYDPCADIKDLKPVPQKREATSAKAPAAPKAGARAGEAKTASAARPKATKPAPSDGYRVNRAVDLSFRSHKPRTPDAPTDFGR